MLGQSASETYLVQDKSPDPIPVEKDRSPRSVPPLALDLDSEILGDQDALSPGASGQQKNNKAESDNQSEGGSEWEREGMEPEHEGSQGSQGWGDTGEQG